VERRQRTGRDDLEYRAIIAVGAVKRHCPVEISIRPLDQPDVGKCAVWTMGLRAKGVKRGQRAAWCDAEDRATAIICAVGSALARCPIEIPIGGLDQPCVGEFAVRLVKAVKSGQLAVWGDFEDRATRPDVIADVGPAIHRCPVEVPIRALDQSRDGSVAVRALVAAPRAERVKRGKSLRRCDNRRRRQQQQDAADLHAPVEFVHVASSPPGAGLDCHFVCAPRLLPGGGPVNARPRTATPPQPPPVGSDHSLGAGKRQCAEII
jgi:hypothetical protein